MVLSRQTNIHPLQSVQFDSCRGRTEPRRESADSALAFTRSRRIVAGQQSTKGQDVHRGTLAWMKSLCCLYQLLSYAAVVQVKPTTGCAWRPGLTPVDGAGSVCTVHRDLGGWRRPRGTSSCSIVHALEVSVHVCRRSVGHLHRAPPPPPQRLHINFLSHSVTVSPPLGRFLKTKSELQTRAGQTHRAPPTPQVSMHNSIFG